MNELLKAVLEEMRAVQEGEPPETWRVHDWADRLEDAIPRAVAEMFKSMEAVQKLGNAAMLRDALKETRSVLAMGATPARRAAAIEKAEKALKAKPRNCDVFTDPAVGEAAFEASCKLPECDKCPLDKVQSSCVFSWDQAEFKGTEEEADGSEGAE